MLATGSADSSIGILSYNEATKQWNSSKILKAHEQVSYFSMMLYFSIQGVNAVSWAPAIHMEAIGDANQPLPRRLVSCGNDKILKIWT